VTRFPIDVEFLVRTRRTSRSGDATPLRQRRCFQSRCVRRSTREIPCYAPPMESTDSLANLSERQLLHRFGDLVRQDRQHTAQLLTAIAEIDERKLWAKHACPSMFAFCVERFHMSESMTAKRIWAARTARRFPVILQMVARGELHLSAIVKIARHLTEDNHRGLLERARHKSSREIEVLVAELAPRLDVPSRIRALPRTTRSVVRLSGGSGSERATEAKSADACTTESKTADERTAHDSKRTTEAKPTGARTTEGLAAKSFRSPLDATRSKSPWTRRHTTSCECCRICSATRSRAQTLQSSCPAPSIGYSTIRSRKKLRSPTDRAPAIDVVIIHVAIAERALSRRRSGARYGDATVVVARSSMSAVVAAKPHAAWSTITRIPMGKEAGTRWTTSLCAAGPIISTRRISTSGGISCVASAATSPHSPGNVRCLFDAPL